MRLIPFVQRALLIALTTGAGHFAWAQPLEAGIRQLIVSIAPEWSASRGTLRRYERGPDGQWHPVGGTVPVLYGKNGLAWGRGVRGADELGLRKREGDGRSPAGVFALGVIYGNEASLPDGADFPFHQVTANDAWPDDPRNPFYNQHVTVDGAHPPAWFASQRMRTGDAAYRWRVEIRHNADPVEPGAGSATFFHIRRGETRRTSGCTTMAEPDLRDLVVWLRASAKPHYVLLPRAEYERLAPAWGLPAPGRSATGEKGETPGAN
ncbi:MAG TPA: L,D-transpeptidase family protein [Planctomycetota bacterium]|nr:L,D-transpeptidase family protein [Planctomycetota bacterium]